ncbi:alpha/beta fold hydrolase [Roseibium alexandrii]|uniref:Putative hydrolase or acyltransferase (Alpha/beta hydrolase superfamily) n=1 Tax=Roseibium alexandrii (strain DSM 17067 / NCIMB 14079 / DFL-11) TaxID=244592 RepID=A0A5E8H7L3_ROSAD|nr:alpha/beta hydrolase [Roseibium alexandrii]EEE48074.2 putative hydrolase or acyltransferase (alpha/beta hydrolase superfamily) [Roseibium alexandrii DFL-11]
MDCFYEPDFLEAGSGHRVILIHSSVAGARQWRALMDNLSGGFHLVAINLFGYGNTKPWPEGATQSLEDQARLVEALVPADGSQVSIVGHSFGGSVAMKAAALLKGRIHRLVLIEPNPFYLLQLHGRDEAYQEAVTLRDLIKAGTDATTWSRAAEYFANYWTGAGSWEAMPEDRKAKFIQALRPNFHEWDSVMNEQLTLSEWARELPKETTVISAADTVRSIDEIVALMRKQIPDWTFEQTDHGGHMAALTHPELMNPIIANSLNPN